MKWITANDLSQWADTIPAKDTFPEMIGDLVRASSLKIESFRFPSGDMGQVRGFDGYLEAEGSPPYVPDGSSIWELGVGRDLIPKANSDYQKRTKETPENIRQNTTFVFATPRTWNQAKIKLIDWEHEKQKLGEWKSVKYFDGSILENWLDEHPAVASRYARETLRQIPPNDVFSTEEFWEEFSTRFNPPLVEEVLLADRKKQADTLLQNLLDGDNHLQFAADSPDEVIAFTVAVIRKAKPETRLFLESRALIIDSENAARFLTNKKNLIFLPKGRAKSVTGLLTRAGQTITSAGADEKHNYDVLVRPSSTSLGKALELMGYSQAEGYDLARQCGRSLTVLARKIPSGTAIQPEWIQHYQNLLPALLAGAWSASTKADKDVLKEIAGVENYELFEEPIRPLTKLKDPPIDRIGDIWSMRSSVDAFIHLAHLLGSEHFSRFHEAAIKVFSTITPAPVPGELFRPKKGLPIAHSNWLRDGMMTTLLQIAALHEQVSLEINNNTPQGYVNNIIRSLPGLSSDYHLMASLNDQLPLLAEAAPIPFLEALEHLLEGDGNAIRPIFEEQQGLLASRSNYTGLLWALEILAWDPDYLLRASLCLARLAKIDPGGPLSNRPINSLRNILLTWAPNTYANSKQRLGVISHTIKSIPDIAWPLIIKLLPSHHDISRSTAKPKLRESERNKQEVITYRLVWESQAEIIELALQLAGNDSSRWELLISSMNQFQLEQFKKTLAKLEEYLDSQTPESRFRTWNHLRKEVNRHRAFTTAEWSLQNEYLEEADKLVLKFQPDNPLLLNSWLFDDWMPDIPGKGDSITDAMEEIESLRLESLRKVHASLGVNGIIELSKQVQLPQLLSTSIQKLALPQEQLKQVITSFLKINKNATSVVSNCVADGSKRFKLTWVDDLKTIAQEMDLSLTQIAMLLLDLPETKDSWDRVCSFGKGVELEYWKIKYGFHIAGNTNDLLFVCNQYLEVDRAMTAIEISHQRLKELESSFLLKLLAEALTEINQKKVTNPNMIDYYIEHVFTELESRTNVPKADIARLEFSYLPIFSLRKKPLVLHQMLVEDPDFFMSTICSVFKAENEDPPELTIDQKRLANAAYGLLNSLDVIPGQKDKDIDLGALQNWCAEVRRLSVPAHRQRVTDSRIGHLLAHAPSSSNDHAWPHESVRTIIEILASDEVGNSIISERYNMRGVYSKSPGEGGDQERALAHQADEWAESAKSFPRTYEILKKISKNWSEAGKRADLEAQKDALRW